MMARLTERSARTGQREPVVVEAFSLAIDVFRPLSLAYAAYLAWGRHAGMTRPWLAVAVLAVLGLWSLALLLWKRRSRTLAVAEVALSIMAILSTMWIETPQTITGGGVTLPTFWVAGSVSAAAVVGGARGGLLAAVAIGVADLVEVGTPTRGTVHNILILLLLGGLIGLAVDLARAGQSRLEAALVEQERLRERERLARAVHDGVLQTLAFIHRKGGEVGGEAAELAHLAAEQERSLRRLVAQTVDAGSGAPLAADVPLTREGHAEPPSDLAARLAALESEAVSVSLPGNRVLVDVHRADELVAAVVAALDNVARHAGPGARAWVLLEDDTGQLTITVRDNGIGAEPVDIETAEAVGRLGCSISIRGRARELGGDAVWSTRPGAGCTVRITVPRQRTQATRRPR